VKLKSLYENMTESGLIDNSVITDLKNTFDIKDIILFGSRAYGSPDKNSDIDLIVVLNKKGYFKTYTERIDKSLEIYKSLQSNDTKYVVDLMVYTNDEWEKLLKGNSSFIRQVSQKCIQI
jgi:uncharacterized protein